MNGLQMLLVISPDWDALEGTLFSFERQSPFHPWKLAGSPIATTLGRKGMAWGRGMLDVGDRPGEQKREGDGKSPAGCFLLGPVFGDELHRSYAKKMLFLPVTEDVEWVDDPNSLYYNQYVNSAVRSDWTSSEKMQEIGSLYEVGVVIQHNTLPIEAGAGSAIFLHQWRKRGEGSGGCTLQRCFSSSRCRSSKEIGPSGNKANKACLPKRG